MGTVFREACDACHRRKTRCPPEGVGACANCRRSGYVCQFSPRDEMGRPRYKAKNNRESKFKTAASAPAPQGGDLASVNLPTGAPDDSLQDTTYFGSTWLTNYFLPATSQGAMPSPSYEYPPMQQPSSLQQLSVPLFPLSPDHTSPQLDLKLNLEPASSPADSLAESAQATVNKLIEINYEMSQISLSLGHPDIHNTTHELIDRHHEKLKQTFPLISSLRSIIVSFATNRLQSAAKATEAPNMQSMLLIALSITLLYEIIEKVMQVFRGILLKSSSSPSPASAPGHHDEVGHDALSHMLSDATLIEFYMAQLQRVLAPLQGEIDDQWYGRIDGLRTSLLDFVKELRKGI